MPARKPAEPPALAAPVPPAPTEGAAPPAFIPYRLAALHGIAATQVDALWEPACAIAARLSKQPGVKAQVAFDPATIMAIISVLIEAIRMYRECRTPPATVVRQAKEGGLGSRLSQLTLRRAVRAQFDDPVIRDELGDRPAEAIWAYMGTVTVAQAEQAFAAVL